MRRSELRHHLVRRGDLSRPETGFDRQLPCCAVAARIRVEYPGSGYVTAGADALHGVELRGEERGRDRGGGGVAKRRRRGFVLRVEGPYER